jgi:hypothetical protein
LTETEAYRLKIMDSLISNKAVPPKIRQGVVRNRSEPNRKVGGKRYPRVVVSEVERGERKDLFVFELEYPHRLLEWSKSNGDGMRVGQSHFLYYWRYTGPQDRPLGIVQEEK